MSNDSDNNNDPPRPRRHQAYGGKLVKRSPRGTEVEVVISANGADRTDCARIVQAILVAAANITQHSCELVPCLECDGLGYERADGARPMPKEPPLPLWQHAVELEREAVARFLFEEARALRRKGCGREADALVRAAHAIKRGEHRE